MTRTKLTPLICSFVFLLSLSRKSHSFLMSCENDNAFPSVVPGDPLEFHCTSNKPFHSCLLEREVNRKISQCKFEFYQPFQYSEEISSGKELTRVGYDCKLDQHEPYRIRVLEKNNQMACHLKINSAKFSGMKILSVFCLTCNNIL